MAPLAHFASAACVRGTVVRGIKFALIVGPILTTINQYDSFLDQHFPPRFYMKLGLTFLVPFLVSVCSSTMANLSYRRTQEKAEHRGSQVVTGEVMGEETL